MRKIILDLCGGTGSWSEPYREAGYDVIVVTLPEHDVRLYEPPEGVHGILAAPPCPMFSFARTNAKKPRDLLGGMEIVVACLNIIWKCQYRLDSDLQKYSPLEFWALENPSYGMLKWFLGKPAFIFQPYEFGDNYQKQTALWGHFKVPIKQSSSLTPAQHSKAKTNSQPLPKFDALKTKEIAPEYYGKLDRKARRAMTPTGFARAFFEANR
ncbi:MAG: hypothetical protein ABID54_03060 [Pseudomonadota bacterium]